MLLALNFSSEVNATELASRDIGVRRFTASLLPVVTLFDKATDGVETAVLPLFVRLQYQDY